MILPLLTIAFWTLWRCQWAIFSRGYCKNNRRPKSWYTNLDLDHNKYTPGMLDAKQIERQLLQDVSWACGGFHLQCNNKYVHVLSYNNRCVNKGKKIYKKSFFKVVLNSLHRTPCKFCSVELISNKVIARILHQFFERSIFFNDQNVTLAIKC